MWIFNPMFNLALDCRAVVYPSEFTFLDSALAPPRAGEQLSGVWTLGVCCGFSVRARRDCLLGFAPAASNAWLSSIE